MSSKFEAFFCLSEKKSAKVVNFKLCERSVHNTFNLCGEERLTLYQVMKSPARTFNENRIIIENGMIMENRKTNSPAEL